MKLTRLIKRNKLVVALITSLLLATTFLVVGGYQILTTITKENGQNFIFQSVQLFGETLAISIENKKENVNNLIFDDSLIGSAYSKAETTSYESHLLHLFTSSRSIRHVIFLDKNVDTTKVYTYDDQFVQEMEDYTEVDFYLTKEADTALTTMNFDSNGTATGRAYYIDNEAYLNIYQQVHDHDDELIGVIVVPMNLQVFFENFLDDFELSYKGYPVVKNQEMDYLMHPSTERVGQSIVELRQQDSPDADVSDLKRLEEIQMSQESGKVEFTSYRQTRDNQEQKRHRIGAFQWITIGTEPWLVMIDADYNEVTRDITEMGFIGIALFVMIIIGCVIVIIAVKKTQDKEKVDKENRLLKELQVRKDALHKQEKKLYEISKMETIGILTTSIVHEMNNFLTPILVNSELVLEGYTPEDEQYDDLQEIVKAARIGKQMSSNILRFSRDSRESGHYQFYDVAEIFAQAAQQVAGIIPEKIVFNVEIDDDLGIISVSLADIQSLVYNLVKNAFQAIQNQQGKITVSLQKVDAEQSKSIVQKNLYHEDDKAEALLFKVEDNGVGMSEKELLKACEPLFSTKRQEEGTGLGLYVVSSIVKKYDWEMRIDSLVEKGTTVSIILFNNNNKN